MELDWKEELEKYCKSQYSLKGAIVDQSSSTILANSEGCPVPSKREIENIVHVFQDRFSAQGQAIAIAGKIRRCVLVEEHLIFATKNGDAVFIYDVGQIILIITHDYRTPPGNGRVIIEKMAEHFTTLGYGRHPNVKPAKKG
eukprot:CAMPEP_0201503918 /NCGR_PEP_ID=MMETSP0151_2-20130828/84924_1 /ASSEMBLY_ACC=CAM_ASM_000257 /TAXON_ID=200890 /ORGANISM="Paramoeba atlantica, Strain 621/1 / CCAP 1560/9" /LENGTH=141 /DNA_ID=CAMNT_0047897617 /DNA_START=11 /DNA_END=436 /DNA_ORIENTATION=+